MCKVYNQVGSLTQIKAHLYRHEVNEYRSVNELINFQKDYSFTRQRIISNHQLLVEKEKNTLAAAIGQLEHSIQTKKTEIEQQLLLEIGQLEHQLENLPSVHANMIRAVFNYVIKTGLKLKIKRNESAFDFKIANSVKHLTEDHSQKSTRNQYLVSCFDDAVAESSLLELHQIDRKKRIIDEINNTIYGALGEQKVVKALEKLPDDYILINDFACMFQRAIYNRQGNDYIKSIQIDHILVAPSGVFLIETKNWSQLSLDNPDLFSPIQQIKRTNLVLYKILNGQISAWGSMFKKYYWGDRKIPVKNLIVFIDHKPTEQFQHVKIVTLNELLRYVSYFKPCFSVEETRRIADYLLNFMGERRHSLRA